MMGTVGFVLHLQMLFLPVLDLFLDASIETIINSGSCFFLFRIAIADCHSNISEDSLLDSSVYNSTNTAKLIHIL